MAVRIGGKQIAAFQIEVKSAEEWDSLMQKPGLIVIDVYAAWCGPCKSIINTFKRIKIDCSDELLNFAIAQSDGIEALKDYSGKSQPTFLFYGSGHLVDVVHGCDGPLLTKTILSLLKREHDILNGTIQPETLIKKTISNKEEERDEEKPDPEEERLAKSMSRRLFKTKAVTKRFAVAIIKPDIVKAGAVENILKEIMDSGLEILKQEEKLLTCEMAAEFYKQNEKSQHFKSLIEFMSSGPCIILLVSKPGNEVDENFIPEFLNLIGPTDINLAKVTAPNSLRAKYGTDVIQNAIHSSDSDESALRELAFFFPDFNFAALPYSSNKSIKQRTLALICPNAYKKHKVSILNLVKESGFTIAMHKEIQFTRTQAEQFYERQKFKDYYETLITTMTSGPSFALCLEREDAIQTWRKMIGPNLIDKAYSDKAKSTENGNDSISLCEKFAESGDIINPFHGSESESCVVREMNILFPVENTVAVIKPDQTNEVKEAIINKFKAAGFIICMQKEVNLTKEMAAIFYKEHEGEEFFDNLTDYMSSGPSHFFILSKQDAVSEFQRLMGPTQPSEAKEKFPDSLRAQFAKDEIKNAVHGSSSVSKARDVIERFFPEFKTEEIADGIDPKEGVQKNENSTNHQNGEIEKSESAVNNDNEGSNTPNAIEVPASDDVFEPANTAEDPIESGANLGENIANKGSEIHNVSESKDNTIEQETDEANNENGFKSESICETSNVIDATSPEDSGECSSSKVVAENITDSDENYVTDNSNSNDDANNTDDGSSSAITNPPVDAKAISLPDVEESIISKRKSSDDVLKIDKNELSNEFSVTEIEDNMEAALETDSLMGSDSKVETNVKALLSED